MYNLSSLEAVYAIRKVLTDVQWANFYSMVKEHVFDTMTADELYKRRPDLCIEISRSNPPLDLVDKMYTEIDNTMYGLKKRLSEIAEGYSANSKPVKTVPTPHIAKKPKETARGLKIGDVIEYRGDEYVVDGFRKYGTHIVVRDKNGRSKNIPFRKSEMTKKA